jgi:DNA repair exonuclease SbcCD ATPase subunit
VCQDRGLQAPKKAMRPELRETTSPSSLSINSKKDIDSNSVKPSVSATMKEKDAAQLKTRVIQSPQELPLVSVQQPSPSTSNLAMDTGARSLELGPNAELAKALAKACKHLAEESATLSSFKFRLQDAKRMQDKRTAEFEKSKPHHEKFPDIKESHTLSMSDAGKSVDAITNKVKKQETVLDNLALQTATQLVPAIIARARGDSSSSKDPKDEKKVDEIAKTCAGFKELLERQQQLISDLQRDKDESKKELERVEKKYQASTEDLIEELAKLKTQFQTEFPKEQRKIQDSVETLSKDFEEAKKSAVELKEQFSLISKDMEDHRVKISNIGNRTLDLGIIREQVKKLQDSEEELTTLSADLTIKYEGLSKDFEGLPNKLKDEQSNALVAFETRLQLVELEPQNYSRVVAQVDELEKSIPRITLDIATKTELHALEHRVKLVENPPSDVSNRESEIRTSLSSRVQELEKLVKPLSEKLKSLEEIGIFKLKISDFQTLAMAHASQGKPSELEKEIKSTDKATMCVDLPYQEWNGNDSSKLSFIEAEIEALKAQVEVLEGCTGSLIEEGISRVTADNKTKLDAVEIRLGNVETNHTTFVPTAKGLEREYSNLHDEVENAKTQFKANVAELEKKVALNIGNLTTTFNIESNKTTNELQALTHTLGALSSRWDTINTRELAQHMLNQLGEVFPNLQSTEATLQGFGASLKALDGRVSSLSAIQQAPSFDAGLIQNFRDELDNLTRKLDEAESIAMQAEKVANSASDIAAKAKAEFDTDKEVIAQNFADVDNQIAAIDQKIDDHGEELEVLKRTLSWTPGPAHPRSRAATPAGSIHSNDAITPSIRPHGVSKTAPLTNTSANVPCVIIGGAAQNFVVSSKYGRQSSAAFEGSSRMASHQPSITNENARMPFQPSNHQVSVPSVTSEGSSKNQKRRLVATDTYKPTNAFYDSSTTSSPQRKRVCRRTAIKDSDDDLDYEDADPEDAIPQPQVESDDE